MKEVIVNAEDLVCLNKEKLQELIRCKDCKYAMLTYDGRCKYCKFWDERYDDSTKLYLAGDFYCGGAERKEE